MDVDEMVATETLRQRAQRILISQALLLLATATVVLLVRDGFAAVSAVYGGVITLISTWWMAYRVHRAGELTKDNPGDGAVALYGGAIVRFVFVVTALAIGMGVLKLQPLFVLIGFAFCQLGYLLGVMLPKTKPD